MARALIPNSTQVPDVILDHWMAELSGAEFKVLMYIARRTFGFGKDSDRISLNQIARGICRRDGRWLDRGTGLSRTGVKSACSALIARGLLVRQANRTDEGRECEESTYRLNLYATPAGVGRNSAHPGRKEAHPGRTDAGGGQESDPGVGRNPTPQETDQETEQETASAGDGADDESTRLIEELVAHGVGRSVARELATEKPGVCRRYLTYLPYATVRTTPGAWLAAAIRNEYGPPPAYLKALRRSRLSGRTPPRGPGVVVDDGLRESYRQLENRPEAFAEFRTFLEAERDRAGRFAARLSLRRREEHQAAFDTDEYRLELFARWRRGQGASQVPGPETEEANMRAVENAPRRSSANESA